MRVDDAKLVALRTKRQSGGAGDGGDGVSEAIKKLLDALETCHICGGLLSLDDVEPTHCENCCGDCEHDEPNCDPLYVMHRAARNEVAALEAALAASQARVAELEALNFNLRAVLNAAEHQIKRLDADRKRLQTCWRM